MRFRFLQSQKFTAVFTLWGILCTSIGAKEPAEIGPPPESLIAYYSDRGIQYEGRGPDSLLIDRRSVLDEKTCEFICRLPDIRNIEVASSASIPLTSKEVNCIVNGRNLESLKIYDCSLSSDSATELSTLGTKISATSLELNVEDASGWLCFLKHRGDVRYIELLRQSAVSLDFSGGFRGLHSLIVEFSTTSGTPKPKLSLRVAGLEHLAVLDVAFGDAETARLEVNETPILRVLSIDVDRIRGRIDMDLQGASKIDELLFHSLYCENVDAADLIQLGALKSVRSLKLSNCCDWEKACSNWEMIKYLEDLTLADCGEEILSGFTNARSLKSLTLERDFPNNAMHIPAGLKKLSLIGSMDTLADFKWVEDLHGLEKLNMSLSRKLRTLNPPIINNEPGR